MKSTVVSPIGRDRLLFVDRRNSVGCDSVMPDIQGEKKDYVASPGTIEVTSRATQTSGHGRFPRIVGTLASPRDDTSVSPPSIPLGALLWHLPFCNQPSIHHRQPSQRSIAVSGIHRSAHPEPCCTDSSASRRRPPPSSSCPRSPRPIRTSSAPSRRPSTRLTPS